MIKLGSHDSMTYCRPKKWWMRPLHFMTQCQDKSYKEQYEQYGIRLFDIRLAFDKKGNMSIRHGLMDFKTPPIDEILNYLNEKGDTYLRLILEKISSNDDTYMENYFIEKCQAYEEKYNNIRFFGGNRKHDWKVIYQFKTADPKLLDLYSSTTGSKCDDWYPKLYANANNQKNWLKYKDDNEHDFFFYDFVENRE
jgi:hypothetical protein